MSQIENWSEQDEARMSVIMQNGNSAEHYEHHKMLLLIDDQLAFLEKQKTKLLESRREYINKHNLNKCGN